MTVVGARAVHQFRLRGHLSRSPLPAVSLSQERGREGGQKEETRRRQQHRRNARSEAIAQVSPEWGRTDGEASVTPTSRPETIKPSPSLFTFLLWHSLDSPLSLRFRKR